MSEASYRIFNFSAGPAVLPLPALERVRDNLLNYAGSGLGIMEISHRSSAFEEIILTTEKLFRSLLAIPDSHAVLFTTGGGTQQFSMVPMNLLQPGMVGNYLVTGEWAKRAWEEAQKFGLVAVAASSEVSNFNHIPRSFSLSENPAYLHYTSNNTIYGTQFSEEPNITAEHAVDPISVPLVCDASSDLLHKPLDISKFGLIYAASQKNFGPAGVTVVIIRRDLLQRSPAQLPVLMDYNTHVDKQSLYNTPPTFAIYVIREVLQWMQDQGGLAAMFKQNQAKAKVLYDAIDQTDFYRGHAEPDSRSLMNVTFRLRDHALESPFVKQAEAEGLAGLAGYRAVGGVRASIYNAFPIEGCQSLASFMHDFARKHG